MPVTTEATLDNASPIDEDGNRAMTATNAPGAIPVWAETNRLRGRSVLADTDLSGDEVNLVLDTAFKLKELRAHGESHPYLAGKTIGLIFQHPSTRTRNAFQAGMEQLGGHATFLGTDDLQLTRGETLDDTAKIMSRYVDGVAARFARHDDLLRFAGGATIPVHNALSERYHPIEALSDLFTLCERFNDLAGLKLAYIGEGNNVCHSLLLVAATVGMDIAIATPAEYRPADDVLATAHQRARESGAAIHLTTDPHEAALDADAIYTDVHESMGQPDDVTKRLALIPFKVTTGVMAAAKPSAVFMHCLPMHRGEEVDEAVADGPQSIVYDQAANRLHVHKALLLLTV